MQSAKLIALHAFDWSLQSEQVGPDYKMKILRGAVVGWLVSEDAEHIVIAQQNFYDDGLRNLLSIPLGCITDRKEFDVVWGNE